MPPEETTEVVTTSTSEIVTPAPENANRYNWVLVIAALVVLVALAVLLAASQTQNNGLNNQTTTTPIFTTSFTSVESTSVTSATSQTANGQLREYTISSVNLTFSPNEIIASPGDTVRITFVNTSLDDDHDFVIDEIPNASTPIIGPGETRTIEFTVPSNASGTYTFYCSVGDHRAMGMVGTLRIV